MVLGDVSTLQTFVWILNHVSRSNLVSIHPKSMKLGPMTNHNVIFHMVGSIYRLVTIRNSPQFPIEFQNGLLSMIKGSLIYAQGGGGVLPTMAAIWGGSARAIWGGSARKGYLFQASGILKGRDFTR